MTQEMLEKAYPRLAAAVAAYNRTAASGMTAKGSGKRYRQVHPPIWPGLVHYEFLDEDGDIEIGLDVEDRALMGLGPILRTFAGSDIDFESGWEKVGCRLVIRKPDATAEELAETMHRLIADTRPQVDQWLKERANPVQETKIESSPPLNTILYGPPGTGKTYHTINKALAILDPALLASHGNDRPALKRRFDELLAAGRIEFVTFHQSFSYEDFIEGLRAETDDETGQLRYLVKDGVFKSLCDRAATSGAATPGVIPSEGQRRIWKISIDGTGPSATRDYCLKHGEARIGWGHLGDLIDCDLENLTLGSNDKDTLRSFSEKIQPGDILLCIRSVTQVLAVGVVAGEYRYDEKPPKEIRDDFRQVLKVDWLKTDLSFSIVALNGDTRLNFKTVYELTRFKWPALVQALEAAGAPLTPAARGSASEPHVLIIDEINRGNISRIFGELITLIEVSKRQSADEALTARLPYSKRSFSVPSNVFLIGTMNTADRSLAALDNALRRRFVFEEMAPDPRVLAGVTVDGIAIDSVLAVMNRRIEALFDRDHCLGHAYLLPLKEDPSLARLGQIFENEILPLLKEYFFEDWKKIALVLNDHRKPAAHRFVREAAGSVEDLFGPEGMADVRGGERWEVNPAAFGLKESYLGIVHTP